MAKKGLHPQWYQTKIFCDGKFIFEVGSTKKELSVEIWAGNHPFYTGSQRLLDAEGRIGKFERKYQVKSELKNLKKDEKKID